MELIFGNAGSQPPIRAHLRDSSGHSLSVKTAEDRWVFRGRNDTVLKKLLYGLQKLSPKGLLPVSCAGVQGDGVMRGIIKAEGAGKKLLAVVEGQRRGLCMKVVYR